MAGEYLTDEELLATSKSSASRAKASNEYLTDEELLASGNDDNWDAAIAAQAEHAKRTRGIEKPLNTVIETTNSAAEWLAQSVILLFQVIAYRKE